MKNRLPILFLVIFAFVFVAGSIAGFFIGRFMQEPRSDAPVETGTNSSGEMLVLQDVVRSGELDGWSGPVIGKVTGVNDENIQVKSSREIIRNFHVDGTTKFRKVDGPEEFIYRNGDIAVGDRIRADIVIREGMFILLMISVLEPVP